MTRVIILGALALIGMLVVQAIWLSRSLDSQKRQFAHTTQTALRATALSIIKYNGGDTNQLQPVERLSSNYFVVPMNEPIQPSLLKSLLKREFELRNIQQDFEFSIYDCSNEKIVFGSQIQNEKVSAEVMNFPTINKDEYYFSVLFPGISFQLIQEMNIWLISVVILLIIVSVFAFTVIAFFKQKRLTDFQRDFINNMTHEFKTPLSTISICTEVLSQRNIIEEPSRLQQYTGFIKKETERMTTQVQKLLQVSKLENHELELEFSEVDISALVHETASFFYPKVENLNGTLTIEAAHDIKLYTDAFHLSNALHNLLDNALKYIGETTPEIKVKVEEQAKHISISVVDNGLGISISQQKLIFNRFYRVPTGDRHDVKGFGLGLHYVMFIMEKLGGRVSVESKIGKGSTFRLIVQKDGIS